MSHFPQLFQNNRVLPFYELAGSGLGQLIVGWVWVNFFRLQMGRVKFFKIKMGRVGLGQKKEAMIMGWVGSKNHDPLPDSNQ